MKRKRRLTKLGAFLIGIIAVLADGLDRLLRLFRL